MNATDFAALFKESDNRPIEWEGHWLYPFLSLHVSRGDFLDISILRSAKAPIQGLSLSATSRKVELETNGTSGRSFALWSDTAPKHTRVKVLRPVRSSAEIMIRNIWRDEKYGATMYALNAAAIQIDQQGDNEWVLRCSDGWGTPDFNDLIVLVRHVRSALSEARAV